MAITAAHWEVDRPTSVITYTGGDHGTATASYATVIEWHRWLQDLADDATAIPASNDELDITDILPSSRATDNFITLLGNYTLTDVAAEHLYDGSVVSSDGTIYDGIVNYGNIGIMIQLHQNGAVLSDDFWNFSVGGSDTSSTNNTTVMTDTGQSWTVNQWADYVIRNTTDGSHGLIVSNTATTITVAELIGGTDNDWDTSDAYLISQGLNSDSTQGISHRFLVKVNNAGSEIDSRKLLGTNRTYLKTYGEFLISATARGNNVLALADALDLNNTTAETTVSAWTDIFMDRTDSTTTVNGVNSTGQAVLNVADGTQFTAGDFIMSGVATDATEYQIDSIATNALTLSQNLQVATAGAETVFISNYGFTSIDVDNNSVNENYYTQWDRGAKTINQFTEYEKYTTRDGAVLTKFGMNPELFRGISTEITIDTPSGTWSPCEDISWTAGSGGATGTGQMLAINSPTAGTSMWIQIFSGGAPGDNGVITGGISGATSAVNVTVTDRSPLIKTPYVGVSTGSAIIGSYGLALQSADLASTDLVFDLTNASITPPNNVTFSVNNPEAGEDYILVAPWDGTSTDAQGDPEVDYNQLLTNALLSADNITAFVMSTTIPSDTPSTGFIRVEDDDGFWRKISYDSWSSDTFTSSSSNGEEDFASVNAGAGSRVFIAYIDRLTAADPEEFTFVYSSDRKFVIKARDGAGTPIKEYIATGTMGANGGSTSVIRVSDA